MKSNPLVSFVICEHNTPVEYFREAMKSVLSQTYKNIEVILVDDVTNIELSSEKILNDKRVKVIHNKTNKGLAASRNVGVANSSGKYIAIMDTDDICEPNRIEEQVKFMEKHKDVICAGSYVRLFGERTIKQKYSINSTEYYRCCLFFGNSPTLTNPSVIIRKEALEKFGIKYDESLFSAEDYMMWVRLSEVGKFYIIKKILLNYRIRKGQMSQVYKCSGLGPNGIKIRNYQLSKIGFDAPNVSLLYKDHLLSDVDLVEYTKLLSKVYDSNKKSKYYKPRLFKKCVNYQIKQKIYSSKFRNIYPSAPAKLKAYILWYELIRPFNIFIRFKNYLMSK